MFYFPADYTYFPISTTARVIVTKHDMTDRRVPHLLFPTWRSRFLWEVKIRMAMHRSDLVFTVSEGQRVYIERINIRGNTRTRDYVIRREFDVAEGDAYNRAIEAFNRDYKTYGECIKKYVDNTNVWIKLTADTANKAIDEYNKYTADLKATIESEKK